MRSEYTSMWLGIVSLLFPCTEFCSFMFAVTFSALGAPLGWPVGLQFIVLCLGLSIALGLAAVIIGKRAATQADNELRHVAAIGTACGFVSLAVSAALLLVGLVLLVGSILCPYPYC